MLPVTDYQVQDDESLHNQPARICTFFFFEGEALINLYQFYPPDDPGVLLKDDLNPSGVSGALGEASEDDLGHVARCDGAQELDAFEGRWFPSIFLNLKWVLCLVFSEFVWNCDVCSKMIYIIILRRYCAMHSWTP